MSKPTVDAAYTFESEAIVRPVSSVSVVGYSVIMKADCVGGDEPVLGGGSVALLNVVVPLPLHPAANASRPTKTQ